MCGICGFYGFEDKKLLGRMMDVISHRGPDESGVYTDKDISLGHQRLSVIDLETGKQPIHNEDRSVWIVHNGEIYNFIKLREELEKKNHKFYTNSDAEVIVHCYEEYGEKCVEKFNGMFAFAIWDSRNKKLFMARDRLGKKPLYYALVDGKFFFASEMKSILQYGGIRKEIDYRAVDNFLTLLYIPAPRTVFMGIKKLQAAHMLTFKEGKIEVKEYWDLGFSEERKDKDNVEKEVYNLLKDAVGARLVSDVPLGAFLSGGIDSSIIVGLMSQVMESPVKTISIGFEEKKFDETKYARIVAEHFRTDHKEYTVSPNAAKIFPRLVWHYDEPFADASAIPMYYVSQIAKKEVTVVLTGDGGDEAFAGYHRYWYYYLNRKYRMLPSVIRNTFVKPIVNSMPATKGRYNFVGYARKFVNTFDMLLEEKFLQYHSTFDREMKDKLYSNRLRPMLNNKNPLKPFFERCQNCSVLGRMQYVDIKTSLPGDMNVKVDRMASANAIETRSPLMDFRVMELAASIGSGLKLRGLNSKYILKESVRKLLPMEILKRKKAGFAVPIRDWFRDELRDLVKQVLLDKRTSDRGYFNQVYVERIIEKHQRNENDYSYHIWALLNLELWHRMFVDEDELYRPSMELRKYL